MVTKFAKNGRNLFKSPNLILIGKCQEKVRAMGCSYLGATINFYIMKIDIAI